MKPRLFPSVPDAKYLCFYPMDRKRGEQVNWYTVPFAERQRMMHEHGMIGRRYGDVVKQIISGSIGMDDWEWGVDLFADDPVVFKKLIYEMRFDEVSAVYALFGQFFIGVRLPVEKLGGVAERTSLRRFARAEWGLRSNAGLVALSTITTLRSLSLIDSFSRVALQCGKQAGEGWIGSGTVAIIFCPVELEMRTLRCKPGAIENHFCQPVETNLRRMNPSKSRLRHAPVIRAACCVPSRSCR